MLVPETRHLEAAFQSPASTALEGKREFGPTCASGSTGTFKNMRTSWYGAPFYLTGIIVLAGNTNCCVAIACEKEKAASLALSRLALLQPIGQSTPALGGLQRIQACLRAASSDTMIPEMIPEILTSFAGAAAQACSHMHSAGPHVVSPVDTAKSAHQSAHQILPCMSCQ